MFVDPKTGQVFEELTELSDEQLGDMCAEMEEEFKALRERYYSIRNAMISRMNERDAKMHLASNHKIRLRKNTQVKGDKASRKLLAELMKEVPSDLRKAFSMEVTASVSGLKEIAKLGGQYRLKVDALLEERSTLVIEPRPEVMSEPMPDLSQLEASATGEAGLPW